MTPSQGVDVIERTESMTNLEKMDIWQEMDVIENCPKVWETPWNQAAQLWMAGPRNITIIK